MTVTSPWWQQWEGFPVLNCFSARQGLGVLVLNVRYTATAMDWNDTVQPGSAHTQSISEATMAVPSQTLPVQPLSLSLSLFCSLCPCCCSLSVSLGWRCPCCGCNRCVVLLVCLADSFGTVLGLFFRFVHLVAHRDPPTKQKTTATRREGEERRGSARKKKTKRASAHARNGPDGSRIRHGSFP